MADKRQAIAEPVWRAALRTAAQGSAEAPVVYKQYGVEVQPGEGRTAKFIITTDDVDREKDVVATPGIVTDRFEANPVVPFGHDYKSLPVGRCIRLDRGEHSMTATVEFATADMNPMAEQVYRMVKAGFLKATSIGFRPMKWVFNEERDGMDFQQVELLEFSIVPVPANPMALVAARAAGIDTAVLKDWADATLAAVRNEAAARASADIAAAISRDGAWFVGESVRWNRQLPKSFDVADQEFPPRSAEQALIAKYCDCTIKVLHNRFERIPSARMGTFLSALADVLKDATINDLRNVRADGTEEPPLYEKIQLNSKQTGEFLIDGLRFMQWNRAKMALRVSPRWFGMEATIYAAREQRDLAEGFFAKVKEHAAELNFLKGEAFSLSGEFLTRGGESLDDLFLDEKNQAAVKRLLTLIESKGATLENRGALLVGPPGTGKTLSGRILMNKAPATFIWVSSRDFHYCGAFGGVAEAFEMARECAPTVLFIEDVDNWLTPITVDLLKTEMDGIAQTRGVVTVLTTNYPELLPKALIDRPGRFHDVLRFDLPNDAAREQMLVKWLPTATAADLDGVVQATAGYSGAHVRELARFATIIAEQESLAIKDAIARALVKLAEQRDLITAVQVSGSRYRAPGHVATKALAARDIPPAGDSLAPTPQPPSMPLAPSAEPTGGEEDAELVAYQTLATLLDQADAGITAARKIVGQLIAAETERPTQTAAQEAAEETLETAQLASVTSLVTQAQATLQAVCMACGQINTDVGMIGAAGLPAVVKAGRVLSKHNETILRHAHGSARHAVEQIEQVLRAVEEDRDEEPAPQAGDATLMLSAEEPADVELRLLLAEEAADITLELDDESGAMEFDKDELVGAIKAALAEIVGREAVAAVNVMRGRID